MGRGDFLAVAEGRVIRFQVAHVSQAEIQGVVHDLGNGGWVVADEPAGTVPAIPALVPTRRGSLPRPANWLAGVFRGGA